MKDWIFITDFDNTMSEKDFYHIVIDECIGEEARNFYRETKFEAKNGVKIGVDFLNKVLGWRKFTQQEHDMMLEKVAIDMDSKKFHDYIIGHGGDFLILSAGFDYYIHKTLEREGFEAELLTNPGNFKEGIFKISPDIESPYYSDVYGIDKGKVLLAYKECYKTVYFMGDSEPDYHAAIHADIVFAKDELYELMVENGKECYHVHNYAETLLILEKLV